jgi:hypothetical protein
MSLIITPQQRNVPSFSVPFVQPRLLGPIPRANMFGWWNTQNAYSDYGKTTKCVNSGTCNVLADLSGNGYDLVANPVSGHEPQKPTFNTNILNSLPALNFNGSSSEGNQLAMASSVTAVTVPYTVYMVYKIISWTGSSKYILTLNSGNTANYALGSSSPQVRFGGTSDQLGNSTLGFEMAMLKYSNDSDAGVWINNTSIINASNSAGSLNQIFLCSAGLNGSSLANMYFFEMLVFSSKHNPNTGDGLKVRRYLNDKYALGLTLPAPQDPPVSTNLAGWWNSTTAFTDAGNSTPCTNEGDQVYSMMDLSGNGRHLQQSNSSYRPTYRVGGTKKPRIHYAGHNSGQLNYFTVSGISLPVTLYMVWQPIIGYNELYLWTGGNTLYAQNQATFAVQPNISLCAGTTGLPPDQTNQLDILQLIFDSSGHMTATVGNNNSVGPSSETTSFSAFVLGGQGTSDTYYNASMAIYECLLYTGQHSVNKGDGLVIRQFLNAKYNLGWSI